LEPTEEQVKMTYENLFSRLKRRNRKAMIGGILIFVGIVITILLSSTVDQFESEYFEYPDEGPPKGEIRPFTAVFAVSVLGMIVTGLILFGKADARIFDRKQKLFFDFYHTYIILQKYVDVKGNNEKKRATNQVQNLIKYIDTWSDERSPESIYSLPNSIKMNLKEKLLPLVKNKKITDLSKFNQELKKLAYLLYNFDPSENKLREFNGVLSSLPSITEEISPPAKLPKPKVSIVKGLESKKEQKAMVISAIAAVILIGVLIPSELGWGGAIVGGLTVGLMLFLVIRK